jgi:predicted DNA-binding transcriptional regulator AlpA
VRRGTPPTNLNESSLPEVATHEEAAAFCRVGRAHWFTLFREGRGPRAIRLGRSTRFMRAEVLRWLNQLQKAGGR